MTINIKATNLEITAAIEDYIATKIGSLKPFLKAWGNNPNIEAAVEIARTTKHHRKGDKIYRAEVNLRLPDGLIRAEHQEWDIRLAIDGVKDKLQREIEKSKMKRRPQDSRGQEKLRQLRGK